MQKARKLSRKEQARLNKFMTRYHRVCDQLHQLKRVREELAYAIVQLTCPFAVGERVQLPNKHRFPGEPKGICEVVEILPLQHQYENEEYWRLPLYFFRVKRVLRNGSLSQRTYNTSVLDSWRKVE